METYLAYFYYTSMCCSGAMVRMLNLQSGDSGIDFQLLHVTTSYNDSEHTVHVCVSTSLSSKICTQVILILLSHEGRRPRRLLLLL